MVESYKKVNTGDVGTSTKFGGNDVDKYSDYLLGNLADTTNVSPTVFLDGRFRLRNPANTATLTLKNPTFTGDGTLMLNEPYDYYIFIDPDDGNKIKARNGRTGKIDYSSTNDVGAVFNSIFNPANWPITTPLVIVVGPGDYPVRTWGETNFRRGRFKIKGSGSGVTSFIITNDLLDVAGTNRAFAFEALGGQYTSISLGSNATRDSFAVLTNATTDLVAGCHVVIGSNAIMSPGAAKKGEHNRVVKIVATGGSPSQRIILEKYTRDDYNTADAAFIRRVDFLEDVHFEGFEIRSNRDLTSSPGFMRIDFAYNLYMNDIKFKDWSDFNDPGFHTCLVHNSVVNSICNNLIFEQSPERGHSTGENASGYAISCRAACETLFYENILMIGSIRHCFTTTANGDTSKNGHPRNIWLINGNAETTDEASWESHGEGDGINYINLSTHSSKSSGGTDSAAGGEDTDAFGNRCNYVRFINCTVDNNRGSAFSLGDGTHGHQIFNCKAKNIYLGRNALNIAADDVLVNGFFCEDIQGRALLIDGGATNVIVQNFFCKNVNRTTNTNAAVRLEGSVSNISLSNFTIDTTNNATTSPPISSENTTQGLRMNNIQCVGGTKLCDLQGLDINYDHLSCRGGGLELPRFKSGRFEGNASAGTGLWEGQVTDTGGSKRVEGTDGVFREYSVSTINTMEGFRVSNYTERDQHPYIRFRYRLEQTTGLRFFCGWSGADTALGPAGGDPLLNTNGVMLKFDTSSDATNLKIYHNAATATTTTGANVATIDNNVHVFEIRADEANSRFQYRFDYGTWTNITTNVPSGGSDMGVQFYVENLEDTVGKTLNMLEAHTDVVNK